MPSEAAQSQIKNVQSLLDKEDLDEREKKAAENLLTFLSGVDDLGSDEMDKMKGMLERIGKDKRSRHGLGWDL